MRRPRIKPEHAAYRTIDGNVRIGGVIQGIGAEIEDPDGWIWTLTQAMDGTREPADMIAAVRSYHPHILAGDVADAMEQLLDAGFVEDGGAPTPDSIPERERERHSRAMPFYRWIDRTPRRSPWDVQVRLRSARVLLIGVGGTGSAVAQGLTAAGVGSLHLVDADDVELSNLNRQVLYRETDIGKPKVEAASAHLRALNSDVEITHLQRAVESRGDLATLLGTAYDLLVLCADQPHEIRRWANRACLAADLPWVCGGYQGPLATAGVFAPGRGACWECLHTTGAERADLRLAPGQPAELAEPHLPWNPANVVSAGVCGNLITHGALALLTGAPPLEPGLHFGVNLVLPGEPVYERYRRRPDCPACRDSG
jgi:molybdopterin/thiamine biosynthesis adenylyltransferase